MIWASPPEDRPYSDPIYDPFWAAAQDLGVPISLHAVTGMGPESQAMRIMGHEIKPLNRYVQTATLGDEIKRSLTVFIFSGVLEPFPRWKLLPPDNELSWLPFVIRREAHTLPEYPPLHP